MNPGISVWLDLMRLLAAVAVVAQHMNERSIAGKVLWQAGKFGVVAVVVFFVLSGFVIGYVVSSREQTVRAYVVARAARIYSVAILAVPVTLIADAIGIRANDIFYKGQSYFNADTRPLDVVLSWSFLNEVWRTHTFIGTDQPYWSLGFEVWYYAIFGIFHFVKPPKRLVLGALLLLLVGPKIALYFSIWLLGLGAWRAIDATGGRKFGCRRAIVGAGLIVAAVAGWVALVAIVGTPSLAFLVGNSNTIFNQFGFG